MAYTLKNFQDKAAQTYRGLEVAVSEDEGADLLFTLRSSIRLSDTEIARLQEAQAALEAYGKPVKSTGPDGKETETTPETKASEMKEKLVDVLSILSDNPSALREFLAPVDLAVVMSVMTDYNEETQAAEGN